MFKKPLMLNITLSVIITVLSFYTILWHNQNHLIYKKAKKLQKESQKIMALHKQQLSEHSTQISGRKIKNKALKVLKMKRPNKVRALIL